MADHRSLLPNSATAFETAVSEAVAAWWNLPVELLATLYNPLTCVPQRLPTLAREMGVPIWPERWPLTKKRSFTARWIVLSRRRGAETTFRELLAAVDAELVDFRAPPQGLYPQRTMTDAELAAWRARFPELRVYPFRNAVRRPGGFIPGHALPMAPRHSDAAGHVGRRAFIFDPRDGSEHEVPVRVDVPTQDFAEGTFTVSVPTRKRMLVLPAILNRGFIPRRSTAAEGIYVYGRGGASTPDLLPPGQPLDIRPERVAEPVVRPGGFVPGHALPMVLRRSDAEEHIYERVRLLDPERAEVEGKPHRGGWVLGRSKLRQPPFTLHLTVDTSERRPGGFVPGHALPMVLRRFDPRRLEEMFAAARAAKLGRDRVLVRTDLYRTIRPDDGVPLDGSVRVGQTIRSL